MNRRSAEWEIGMATFGVPSPYEIGEARRPDARKGLKSVLTFKRYVSVM